MVGGLVEGRGGGAVRWAGLRCCIYRSAALLPDSTVFVVKPRQLHVYVVKNTMKSVVKSFVVACGGCDMQLHRSLQALAMSCLQSTMLGLGDSSAAVIPLAACADSFLLLEALLASTCMFPSLLVALCFSWP